MALFVVFLVAKLGPPSSVLRSTSNLALPSVSSDGVFEISSVAVFTSGISTPTAVGVFPRISSAASVASTALVDRPIVASVRVAELIWPALAVEGMIGEILEGTAR